MYQPPKVPQEKSSSFVDWLAYLVRWATAERVLQIKGFTVKQTAEGKIFFPPNILNLSGLQWQNPNKELDPTKSVPKNTLVYVSPENPLVTTGLTDLVSGTVTKASAGVYCSAQNVPAQITVSGTVKYNVPVNPVPGAPSTPGESPLSGDYDGTNVFWLPVGTSGTSSSGGAQYFAITSLSNADYVTGQLITVLSSGSSLEINFQSAVKIAKHNRMRPSVISELIDGVTISYSGYTSDNTRLASDGTNTEYQVAFPRYTTAATLGLSTSSPITGTSAYNFLNSLCVIKAIAITAPTDNTSTWQSWEEITPRVWARRYNQ